MDVMRKYEVHEVWLGINDGDEGERYEHLTLPAQDERENNEVYELIAKHNRLIRVH